MPTDPIRLRPGMLALALLLAAGVALPPAIRSATAQQAVSPHSVSPQAVSPDVIAEYRRKLQAYQQARDAFEQEASAYWASIAEKRKGRNAKRREHQPVTLDDY